MLVSYLLAEKNVFSPGFIICSVFTLSALFVALNGKNWGYSISLEALLYIILALAVTLLGIRGGTKVKLHSSTNAYHRSNMSGNIGSRTMLILSVFSVIIVYVYYKHQMALSVSLGNSSGFSGMIYTIRSHVYDEGVYHLGIFLNLGISFLRAVGFISVFLFIKQLVVEKRVEWRYVLPMISLVLYFVLTTGRSGFISLLCAIMYYFYYSFRKIGKNIRPTKTVLYIIIGFIAFLFLFWQLGKLTGKNTVLSLWDTISIYIGSSILCFDKLICSLIDFNYVGSYTFKGLYNIFAKLGFPVIEVGNHAEMILFNGYSSNVFTAFASYYRDYGPLMSFFFIFVAGFIIGVLWKKFKDARGDLAFAIIYGRYIATAVAMYSISENLFSALLALNAIAECFFVFFIIRISFKRNATDYSFCIDNKMS